MSVRKTAQRRPWRIARLNPGHWPVAVKFIALCVGTSAALAIGLSSMGYLQARAGLQQQAEAALTSDALIVTSAIDDWHARRWHDLQLVAAMPAVQRVVAAGSIAAAHPADVKTAQDALNSVAAGSPEIDSVALIEPTQAEFFMTTDKASLGNKSPQRDYVQEALKGRLFVTGVTISTITNKPSIFHSAPVKDASGKILGVIRTRSNLDQVAAAVDAARGRVGSGGTGALLDANGLVIANGINPDWLLRPVMPIKPDTEQALLKGSQWGTATTARSALGESDLAQAVGAKQTTTFAWTSGGVAYQAIAQPLGATNWTYVAAEPVSTFDASARDFLRNAAIAGVIGLLLASALALVFGRRIGAAIKRVALAAHSLARGDLDCEIATTSRDEIGQMAEAFRTMVIYQQGMAAVAEAMARGDLSKDVQPLSDRDRLGNAFASMVVNLRQLVGEVSVAAVAVAERSAQLGLNSQSTGAAAEQVAAGMGTVAEGLLSTHHNVENTSSTVSQLGQAISSVASGATDQAQQTQSASTGAMNLATQIEDVAERADHVAATSQQTRTAAEDGARAVDQTTTAMSNIRVVVESAASKVKELGGLGEKIGAVVETIDDIAEQTNLLALNAAIEAARAGEQGRGFAVVADEVRKLAERSSRETKQIAQLIGQVQAGTREAVVAAEEGSTQVGVGTAKAEQAASALAQIRAAVDASAGQVQEIAVAARQMADGARAVTDAMNSISAVVEENTAATEEMAAQAAEVDSAIQSIATVSQKQSAAIEEITAGAEEMSAQIQQISADAQEMANVAVSLRELVAQFQLTGSEPVALQGAFARKAA